MHIALCSDELHPVHNHVIDWLTQHGYQLSFFGSIQSGKEEPWVEVTQEAAEAVSQGECDEGIFFCWSGTGACIVANKAKGIRAALCWDSETAELARIWNHANVLILPNRVLNKQMVEKILPVWFGEHERQPLSLSMNA